MRKLFWEEIAETVDLDRVLDELGIQIRDRNRSWLMASCPLPSHPGSDVNPSFGVNQDDLIFNCFVCGGGSLPKLIIEIEGLTNGEEEIDSAWQRALRWLAPFSDIDTGLDYDPEFLEKQKAIIEEKSRVRKRTRREPMPIFSPSVLDKWEDCPLDLLEKWNITKESTVAFFNLKFDPEHERHGYTGPVIVIPHFWKGELVGYQERWLDDDRPKKIPKYSNTNNFPKKDTIFNYDLCIEAAKCKESVIVVESAMTVVRLYDMGLIAGATFGVSFNPSQIAALGALRTPLVLSFDNDVAGKRAVVKLRESLDEYTEIKVLSAPKGEKADLADLSEGAVRDLIATI